MRDSTPRRGPRQRDRNVTRGRLQRWGSRRSLGRTAEVIVIFQQVYTSSSDAHVAQTTNVSPGGRPIIGTDTSPRPIKGALLPLRHRTRFELGEAPLNHLVTRPFGVQIIRSSERHSISFGHYLARRALRFAGSLGQPTRPRARCVEKPLNEDARSSCRPRGGCRGIASRAPALDQPAHVVDATLLAFRHRMDANRPRLRTGHSQVIRTPS